MRVIVGRKVDVSVGRIEEVGDGVAVILNTTTGIGVEVATGRGVDVWAWVAVGVGVDNTGNTQAAA